MDVTNIYIISGYINDKGYYEKSNDYATYVAECRDKNSEYVYYAFLYYSIKDRRELNSRVIRIENLSDFIDDDIIPTSIPDDAGAAFEIIIGIPTLITLISISAGILPLYEIYEFERS